MEIFDYEMLLKLFISAILGLIIGLERELKRKPLGLKTSLVISIVSCLLTIVSIESAYLFPGSDDIKIQMDPLRLTAQIVSGIGFLGAGVILKRENDSISGLTTAAMIWGAAGIGIAVGAGFYIEALAGVILLMISVEIIPSLLTIIGLNKLRKKEMQLKMHLHDKQHIEQIIGKLNENNITVQHTRIKDLKDATYVIHLKINVSSLKTTQEIYRIVSNMKEIQQTEIEG
ncbi:MgtC/SapB family protein [Bacillus chungangensis]|uniref:Mg2+ transporter-C (MgtC) family protein n=1 Tax=Bacillus chungangensis TaxID=587633 RepID=A0ABT9WYY2_9BACI|nr:MgtC/SapB family protein [Bacillus chungangensis]MDQ0178454.1 putative Mg2+ transporter-C (MgtC) family protein [Bacillus chungangensis]